MILVEKETVLSIKFYTSYQHPRKIVHRYNSNIFRKMYIYIFNSIYRLNSETCFAGCGDGIDLLELSFRVVATSHLPQPHEDGRDPLRAGGESCPRHGCTGTPHVLFSGMLVQIT